MMRSRSIHVGALLSTFHSITLLSPLIHTDGTTIGIEYRLRTNGATMLAASPPGASPFLGRNKLQKRPTSKLLASQFPNFVPPQVDDIQDSFARNLASRIERLPVNVSFSKASIMSSCVKPKQLAETSPIVLLHGFDSSCLEWRYTLPLLDEGGLETWAVDILGWGFSDLENRPSSNVASKREHLYKLWNTYIKRPMTLVGPSLGAAVAIDFVSNYPEAVDKLILIDASVYAEGTGDLAKLPKTVAYAGVALLKSVPLRFYATTLSFNAVSLSTCWDWVKIGRLHCLLPWWEDMTVNFMISGGYDVRSQIEHVKQKTLIIWGENDQVIDNKLAVRLHCELPNAIIRQIPDCGHIPHVEKPAAVSKLITDFVRAESKTVMESLMIS